MTTLSGWIEDVRAHLEGDGSEEGNQLDAPYTAGAGQLTMRYTLGSIGPGAILSVGTNTFRVFSANPIGKTVTVQAAWAGSTDADAAAGDLVRVNPRFTDHRIVKAINGALSTISSPANGLYRVGSVDINYSAAVQGYDLAAATGLIDVLEVRRDVVGPSQSWVRLPSWQWEVQRNAISSDFASGAALRLRGLDVDCVLRLHLVYAATFTAISGLSDEVVATTGIPASAEDIPPLGAAIRLMAGREVGRNNLAAQGDARRAQEVGPGAIAQSYRGLLSLFAQRVAEESLRLKAMHDLGK